MNKNLSAAILAVAMVVSIAIAAAAFKYRYRSGETIHVTGAAQKDFTSDLIVWNAGYSRKKMTLSDAFDQLKADELKVRAYLRESGIKDNEVVFSSVLINKEYDYQYSTDGRMTSNVFTGYNLTQYVKVESREMAKVEKVSREISDLIKTGIELSSQEPQYYYTKLNSLKIELLQMAAKDAKDRAEAIAGNTGTKLGKLRNSYMGVFQIIAQNSNEEYSYGGAFNTSSKEKTATITVTADFLSK